MIPTFIHSAILLPGLVMENKETVRTADDGVYDGAKPNLDSSEVDGFEFVGNETSQIYSVDAQKVVTIDEVKVDDQGRLTETLFCLCGMDELQDCAGPNQWPWLWKTLLDCDLLHDGNMQCLYEAASQKVDRLPKEEWSTDKLLTVDFLGLWSVELSYHWEDGEQLDDIVFVGPAVCVLAPESGAVGGTDNKVGGPLGLSDEDLIEG